MKISVVIPVYNEAAGLSACLDAIERQTVEPYEVIVVNNNSSDNTAEVAGSYDFVKLLNEPKQGVVYARDRGFDAARGDIIARIDADSHVAPDWIAQIQHIFSTDRTVDALTGRIEYYGLLVPQLLSKIDLICRRHLAKTLGKDVAIQGANMAMRRLAWQNVRKVVCKTGGLHEDHDLAVHLTDQGRKVIFHEAPRAAIDSRRLETTWRDFCYYAWLSPLTYKKHALDSRRHMYPFVLLAILAFPILKVMRRAYDADTQKFSLQRLFSANTVARANPATFVD